MSDSSAGQSGDSRPYDKVTQASLNGLYVKAKELDRGHNENEAPSALPPGASADAVSHASTHASDASTHASDASTHASDAETHASDAETHASDFETHASDAEAHAPGTTSNESNEKSQLDCHPERSEGSPRSGLLGKAPRGDFSLTAWSDKRASSAGSLREYEAHASNADAHAMDG